MIPANVRYFSRLQNNRTGSSAQKPSIQCLPEALPTEFKQQGLEADQLLPRNVEVKNKRSYKSKPRHVFTKCTVTTLPLLCPLPPIMIPLIFQPHLHCTGYTQKNGTFSKVNKKSISHLTWAQRTPSAAATVQVSHALSAVRFSCLLRGRGASFKDGVAAGKDFLCAPF